MTLPNQLVNNTIADADEVMANFDNLDGRLEDIEQAWIDWTPTWTNLTVGNGTVVAKYTQIGKTIHMRMKLTFGSTTSVTGSVSATYPVTNIETEETNIIPIGIAIMNNSDTATRFTGFIRCDGNTKFRIGPMDTGEAYVRAFSMSATVPFTWATGDTVSVSGTYEAA